MRAEDLLNAIGEARGDHVLDARKKRVPRAAVWGVLAAGLALVIGLNLDRLPLPGGKAGGGGGEGLTYMSYEGPVFPLTLAEEMPGLTASRNVDLDFSPYESRIETLDLGNGEVQTYERWDDEIIITDSYLIQNSTAEDLTVTARYPFAGTINGQEWYPAVTVDGQETQAELHPGPYTGSFTGAYGAENQEAGSLNLQNISSFAGYEALLADGSYQASAFDAFPELTQPVVVYQMTDYTYSSDTEAANPTLQMRFSVAPGTSVFTYGINGWTVDIEAGAYELRNGAVRYRPDLEEPFREAEDAYIILAGGDIGSYELAGFRSGGCEEPLDDLDCTVLRYETTLGEILLRLLTPYTEQHLPILYGITELDRAELCRDLAAELLTTHGALGENTAERYARGSLEDIFSAVLTDPRVFYLTFEVTVPAGESIAVEAVMRKDASIDFIGKGADRDGYDLATRLGSNLVFTEQTASLTHAELITILRQNFGFDPENGILSVPLTEKHYWIEVEKRR